MAVRLRLKRLGRRHQPSYRLSAMDSRSPRDGRVIEELGFYNPRAKDPAQGLRINTKRVAYWLSVGAQPSDTVRALLKRSGMDVQLRPRPTKPPKAKPQEAEAAPAEQPETAEQPPGE